MQCIFIQYVSVVSIHDGKKHVKNGVHSSMKQIHDQNRAVVRWMMYVPGSTMMVYGVRVDCSIPIS